MFKEEKSEIEMSKELIELNSIEIIKNMFIDYDKNFEYYGDFPTLNLERKKAIETILNLIENQKVEIERLKNIISNTSVQFINDTIKTDKKNKEDIESLNEGWKIELEKKDIALRECERNLIEERQNRIKEGKIIDLMSEQLAGLTIFDIDKEEPLILKDKEEVKQYFEKKAEESK